jgi:tetratricopeptide (TPR) repeat protein
LHIFSETGLFGGVTFLLIVLLMAKRAYHDIRLHNHTIPLVYSVLFIAVVAALTFLPISLILLFLFLLLIISYSTNHETKAPVVYNLAEFAPLYIAVMVLLVAFIASVSFFLTRFYMAEAYFKQGLEGLNKNNAKDLYDNERKALSLNPYNENFHIGFAQTNLLIGNNITQSKKELTDTEKQSVVQAIQAAIAESKAAVTLNPYKAVYWENLAGVYRSVLNVAQGADAWTTSAYQRAMLLDPQNPLYPFSLGGVFYTLIQYDQAAKAFEQAVILKPDWANAHYNLAWAYYQMNKFQDGIAQLQAVQSLTDAKKNKADYDKVQKDIESFKSKLPKDTEVSPTPTPAGQSQTELTLPQSTPSAALSPKIVLPKEASPEAK